MSANPLSTTHQFVFDNGHQINTGALLLNEQQQHALQRIADWLDQSVDDAPAFTLQGYAGTGKSTIMRFVLEYMRVRSKKSGKWKETVLTAPTHRAKAILAQLAGKECQTVASLLSLRPDFQQEELDLKNMEFARKPNSRCGIPDRGLLLVDEASMLNDGLLAVLLHESRERNCKVLFIGDEAQIKPVRQQRISKVFGLPGVQLTKVERQKDGNPLGTVLDAIRSDRHSRIDLYGRWTRVNARNEGITFTNATDQVMDWVQEHFRGEHYFKDPNYVRVLAATNKKVNAYNHRIRQIIWGPDAEEYEVGEIIMGYDNWGEDSLGMGPAIVNSADYVVREAIKKQKFIGKGEAAIETLGWNLKLSEPGSKMSNTVYVLDDDTPDETLSLLHREMEHLRQVAMGAKTKEAKATAWNAFHGFREQFALSRDFIVNGRVVLRKTLNYGYAHTVHKSQGGSYQYVFVDEDDIDRAFWQDHELRNQLKYVAFSRARHGVLSYSPKSIEEPTLDIDF